MKLERGGGRLRGYWSARPVRLRGGRGFGGCRHERPPVAIAGPVLQLFGLARRDRPGDCASHPHDLRGRPGDHDPDQRHPGPLQDDWRAGAERDRRLRRGGLHGGRSASELAPTYAPGLDIRGVAEGGIPVDYAHNLAYINGSPSWSGVIPAILVGLDRALTLHLDRYLSPYGLKVTRQVQNECITRLPRRLPRPDGPEDAQAAVPELSVGPHLRPVHRPPDHEPNGDLEGPALHGRWRSRRDRRRG